MMIGKWSVIGRQRRSTCISINITRVSYTDALIEFRRDRLCKIIKTQILLQTMRSISLKTTVDLKEVNMLLK